MTKTVSLNPGDYFLIVSGITIEGINTMNLSFPNDDADIEVDMYGNVTFIENPAGKIFELTLDNPSEQKGNISLQEFANEKLLVPVQIIKASTNTPLLSTPNSRVMIKGWGKDNKGSDVPTNWKIKGTAKRVIHS